jgi:hypothetical protein
VGLLAGEPDVVDVVDFELVARSKRVPDVAARTVVGVVERQVLDEQSLRVVTGVDEACRLPVGGPEDDVARVVAEAANPPVLEVALYGPLVVTGAAEDVLARGNLDEESRPSASSSRSAAISSAFDSSSLSAYPTA